MFGVQSITYKFNLFWINWLEILIFVDKNGV